ncbi:MAG: aminopeptidase [Nanoarchaeota archaeon]|nr:aminopeptidase [Nanoarchaeota archaeon]MBU0963186.1 aminopeptidase [Nanoarchaeota archaeon]
MVDPRITKEAEILINHSVCVKKGEYVIVAGNVDAKELMLELYRLIIKKGAYPSLKVGLPGTSYIYYKNASDEQLNKFPDISFNEIKKTQCYIGIHSDSNTRELTNIDPKKISIRGKVTNPISDYIVNQRDKIKRCSTLFPTQALAQEADMSLQEYEDFVFNAVIQDWNKLKKRFVYLRDQLNKAKKIRIIGEDTDITLNVYKKSFVADSGEENLPGGEIFCAPEPKSINGHIRFTYPAIRSGVEVTNIFAEFKNGKCIKATADKNEKFLNAMLDTDKGSRYIGELGIGMNPKIDRFTKDLLFDEKIGGTIHLAFGMAYKECGQPNNSALHWDIVKDLRKNGQIIADGKVIQKNGKWLI